MRYLGGHLGTAVTALVDGQLDPRSAERAWTHVHGCCACSDRVRHEGWVKRRLATINGDGDPSDRLLGSLYGLSVAELRDAAAGAETADARAADARAAGAQAWHAVGEIERSSRGRRRTGIALAGAGSLSVAMLGFATLSGTTLGIGGAPAGPPTSSLTGPSRPAATSTPMATVGTAPVARVHGRLPGVEGTPRIELRR
jgi:anti-sigma factor RsiW